MTGGRRTPAAEGETTFLGHPKGLTILFLTEMWEIFSFYGMRTLLIYYMTKHLLIGQQHASLIYGLYTAFVYLTPILGGAISDRWLGRHRAVVLGGSIMALGHFMMASEALLFPALAVIALGNGFFLPNLPSQIRGLYREGDPRAGSAFNVYYLGANLGAFLAPLVCGTLGEVYGWHWGFAAAGVGMLAGLTIYVLGRRHLPPEPVRGVDRRADEPDPESMGRGLRGRLLLLAAIAATVVVFRIPYEQVGNTLPLWMDVAVDRQVTAGGWAIPLTWFQSLNPMLVISLTPLLIVVWTRAARRGHEPSPLIKMVIGGVLLSLAFLMLAGVTLWSGGGQVSWLWLAVFFAVLTTAELYVFPIGLGLFGRLAPRGMTATIIALWFLSAFLGNLLAGAVGALWSMMEPGQFFLLLAVLAGASAGLLALLDRPVRRIDQRPAGVGVPNPLAIH